MAEIGAHLPLIGRSTNAKSCPLAAIKGATEQPRGRWESGRSGAVGANQARAPKQTSLRRPRGHPTSQNYSHDKILSLLCDKD